MTAAKLPDGWLTVPQVVKLTGLSRTEVNNRLEPGDPDYMVSFDRRQIDGKPGRLIHFRTLTPSAQDKYRQDTLRAAQPASEPSPGQGSLLPHTELEAQALLLPASQRDVVWRRFRVVQVCLNHDWKVQGFPSKGNFMRVLAERNGTYKSTIEKWMRKWRQRESLLDLADGVPGPPRGTGSVLTEDMRAHLIECYTIQKLNFRQCRASLKGYLRDKQKSPGCKVDHQYPTTPCLATVRRFLRSLSSLHQAARQGADELKSACGYLDRTYRGLPSLGCVCVDEWISDVFAYNPRKVSRVGRYYVLTFLDERSRYPLVWSLVEQPNEQDEIDLLCRLIREFGVPGRINSDRGRFRGKTFGGRFISQDGAQGWRERDGILDRLGIGRNGPRDEHNPRGNRLERFHLELARWARTQPGWCGRDTKERRMIDADARVAAHKEWVRTGQGEPPLLSGDQLFEHLNQFMAEFRQQPSDGTDMDGFAPEAVFRQNTPAEGFRRISDDDLNAHTAESFEALIREGGIIQLSDGKRYSDPQLLLIQGQRREVHRRRHDHEQVYVLPSAKGEPYVVAKRRQRVGVNDPDLLSRQMESQARVRRIAGQITQPMEYDPSAAAAAPAAAPAPKSTDVIHPSEFIAAETEPPAPTTGPDPDRDYISSLEYDELHPRRTPEPWGFADLKE